VLDIKLNKYTTITIGVLVCLISCKKPSDRPCFKSAGKSTVETRELSPYKHIVITDNISLNLTQTNAYSATVSAGQHLQNFIITEVIDDTLYIRNDNRCNNLRSYKNEIRVDVFFEDLHYIKTNTSKNITSTNAISLDTLVIEGFFFNGDIDLEFNGIYIASKVHSGGANVTITGSVEECYAYHIGTGSINYKLLESTRGHIHSRTTANSFMNCKNVLEVEIHSSGNIYYNSAHSPVIKLKKKSSGQLFPN
jgi:hypothetical protein